MPFPKGPIRPMLARSRDDPFDSDDYTFEVKWDGTRVIAFCEEGEHRFQNRRLNQIAYRYPDVRPVVKGRAVLDGEIVVMAEGKPDFAKLQQREHAMDEFKASILSKQFPATYVVFDILHWREESLLKLPLEERRRILEEAVEPHESVYLSEPIRGQGIALFDAAKERGLEGIMAKRLGTPYRPGKRVDYWLKIKTYKTLDCVICGLTVGLGWREPYFGSLILGVYDGGDLRFVGSVGTGFDEKMMAEIAKLTDSLVAGCPFPEEPEVLPGVKTWLKPRLVCEVKYLQFTQDLKLRAPVFLRMRPRGKPDSCRLPRHLSRK